MDFHQLKIFLEVARQKNFTRAAENLFLSQPTVSMHIKKLEEEVGAPLLHRGKEGLEITAAGRVLLRYGEQLLQTKAEALSAIQDECRIVKGHLEIAASSVPGAYLLPRLLRSFCQEYPRITFSVLLRDTGQVLQNIRDYTYDLGFTGETDLGEGLKQIRLVEDKLILVASPEIKIPSSIEADSALPTARLSDCADLPFLLREPGSATRMVFEEALKKLPGKNIALQVIGYLESQEALKEAAKAGLGLTVISQKAVEDELRAGRLKGYRLEDIPLRRSFYLVHRQNGILAPLNKTFLEYTCRFFKHDHPKGHII